MDLNEVAVFIKVIQAGSFSKAAEQLGMPNSTVSARVSSLEKRLGLTLIQRTTRKLNITPAGQAYYTRCLQGLDQIRAAELEVAAGQTKPQGLLRVTAPADLGVTLLPELAIKYATKYPETRVEMLLTDRRVDLLSENFDLAIRAGELKDSSLIAKKLGVVYFAPFASPKYLASRVKPEHPKDLRQHHVVQFAHNPGGVWKLQGPRSAVTVPIEARLSVNDLSALKNLLVAGAGIGLLPTYLCYPEVKAGKLVRILPDWHSPQSPVNFVYVGQRFVSAKLQAFMDLTADLIRDSLQIYEF